MSPGACKGHRQQTPPLGDGVASGCEQPSVATEK